MVKVPTHVKSPYFSTLVELLLLGAKSRPVTVTTQMLSGQLGKSQQALSIHMINLEQDGYIVRQKEGRRFNVKLTDKAVNDLTSYYLMLRSYLEESPEIFEFKGAVFTGLGEGAYYISLGGYSSQFKDKLGFIPFPGTLNLRLASRTERIQLEELAKRQGTQVDGFTDGSRSYGALKFFPALIEEERGAVLRIDRTHYDISVLEVIAPKNLRKALKIKDGSIVCVKVFL